MTKMNYSVILLFSFFSFQAVAQVGINTDMPEQALDVNGKIKIGNDGTTPTEGTFRYGSTGDFEGFTAEGWQSFTQGSSASIIPGDVQPVTSKMTVSPGNTNDATLYNAFTLTSYTTVPSNSYFMVTSIIVTSNNLGTTGRHFLSIGPRTGTGLPISYRSIDLYGERTGNSQIIQDPYGFLAIIRPGEKFAILNSGSSDYTVDLTIRGYFLIPD